MIAKRWVSAAVLTMVALLAACSGSTTIQSPPATSADASRPTLASSAPTARPSTPSMKPTSPVTSPGTKHGASGLPTVSLQELPAEAQQTYALILAGGPYPYSQDGQIFGNREGLLPWGDYGWYREYTVPTPGSPDRGARRFVVSGDGMFFYTEDHYNSFEEVVE